MTRGTKRGRPLGAPNAEYVDCQEIPATCPTCGSTKLTRVPGSSAIEKHIPGTLPSGLRYRSVRWTSKVCECGQRVKVRAYIPVVGH